MTPDDLTPALTHWRETASGRPVLINLSENHTFRIDGADGARHILRVHRPGYQSRAAIRSELEWLEALRRDTGMPVPRPLPGRDGDLVQQIDSSVGPRFAVLFAFEPGREPQPDDDLDHLFGTIGGFAATAHLHAMRFAPSAAFTRQSWSAGAILDPTGRWGDWRQAPHVEGKVARQLDSLDARLRDDLAAYGQGPDRFGLIHADMRLANLLVDGERVTLIDFDDAGLCWFMYDFAAAISFHEEHPHAGQWRQAWLDGYQRIRPLADADRRAIDTMILLRRMALLAWIGSHAETDLAQSVAPQFAAGTVRLAEAYLR